MPHRALIIARERQGRAGLVPARRHDVRHALFVAFHFPPEASSSGVLRTLKYARYLAQYDWRVTVVAPRADAYSAVDPQLEAQIVAPVRVVRTRWLNTKKHLAFRGHYPALLALPDPWIGWLPWGVAAGRAVLRGDPPEVLYSTSPHATAHLIAFALARISSLPWIADFRDPWYEETPEPGAPSGALYRRINRGLERRVIERCSHVVTTTEHLRDELRARYSEVRPEKFSSIPNGYDEADFASSPPPRPPGERMVVVHTGSLNAEFRDPRPLFRSIGRLATLGAVDPRRIALRFVGGGDYGNSSEVRRAVAESGLEGSVQFIERVPFDEALREVAAADLLLLLQASADTTGLVPAKLYEYLRAQRPVLALVYAGASTEVIAGTGGGWAIDPRDERALDATVEVAYKSWITCTLNARLADLDALRRFDRKSLAETLARLFDDAHSGRGVFSSGTD